MATNVLLHSHSPMQASFTQTVGLGKLVGSCVSSFFRKSEFQEVVAWRFSSERGLYTLKDYTWDKASNQIFMQEEKGVVRYKCVLIFLSLPVFAGLKVGYAAVNTVVQTVRVAALALRDAARALAKGELKAAALLVGRAVFRPLDVVGLGIWEIVKAPLFLVAGLFFAAYGMVSPFEGRQYFSSLEKIWNNQELFTKGIKARRPFADESERMSFEKGCVAARLYYLSKTAVLSHPDYLAECFQSRGVAGKDVTLIHSNLLQWALSWIAV